jgi:ssRNA-specific RNase YbeY (16S rRNA maturation enzyme)
MPTDALILDYGGGDWNPQLAEILVCPIFIRALAQVLRLSYGEELRRVLAYALLHPLGYREDTSEVRLRMRPAEERWLALWKPLSCVSHETFRV